MRLVAFLFVALCTLPACGASSAAPTTAQSDSAVAQPSASAAEGSSAAEVVRQYVAALDARDFETAAKLFAPNALALGPTGGGSQRLATSDDARAYLETVPPCNHEMASTRTEGDFIFAAVILSGDACPLAAGTEIEMPFRIEGGRIACICQPGDE